ncbi:MAG: tRNA pseudouridine(38-40) synthase TruA [Clostridia bacterium]|nr:tRNA pseudouridine(38-40) synthase TruA [Clostridia bacterium]
MKVKLTVSYDGTDYCGWQVQPNGVTVQQKIEEAVFSATGESVRVTGSGRTDAGVHAEGQVAHFDTNCTIPPEKICKALNVYLPQDIRVLKSERADDNFHACTNAKKKTYRYSFYLSDVELPLCDRYAVMLDRSPDINLMKKAAKLFVGEHDFKAFCSSGSGAKTTVRTIYDIDVISDGKKLIVDVTGNGFLYNMVRIMVGTLLDVGNEKISQKAIEEMLSTGNRTLGGKTLPAKGLCLLKVEY